MPTPQKGWQTRAVKEARPHPEKEGVVQYLAEWEPVEGRAFPDSWVTAEDLGYGTEEVSDHLIQFLVQEQERSICKQGTTITPMAAAAPITPGQPEQAWLEEYEKTHGIELTRETFPKALMEYNAAMADLSKKRSAALDALKPPGEAVGSGRKQDVEGLKDGPPDEWSLEKLMSMHDRKKSASFRESVELEGKSDAFVFVRLLSREKFPDEEREAETQAQEIADALVQQKAWGMGTDEKSQLRLLRDLKIKRNLEKSPNFPIPRDYPAWQQRLLRRESRTDRMTVKAALAKHSQHMFQVASVEDWATAVLFDVTVAQIVKEMDFLRVDLVLKQTALQEAKLQLLSSAHSLKASKAAAATPSKTNPKGGNGGGADE